MTSNQDLTVVLIDWSEFQLIIRGRARKAPPILILSPPEMSHEQGRNVKVNSWWDEMLEFYWQSDWPFSLIQWPYLALIAWHENCNACHSELNVISWHEKSALCNQQLMMMHLGHFFPNPNYRPNSFYIIITLCDKSSSRSSQEIHSCWRISADSCSTARFPEASTDLWAVIS